MSIKLLPALITAMAEAVKPHTGAPCNAKARSAASAAFCAHAAGMSASEATVSLVVACLSPRVACLGWSKEAGGYDAARAERLSAAIRGGADVFETMGWPRGSVGFEVNIGNLGRDIDALTGAPEGATVTEALAAFRAAPANDRRRASAVPVAKAKAKAKASKAKPEESAPAPEAEPTL